MRVCSKCKSEYPATAKFFCKNKRMKDGLSSWCRRCHSIKSGVWQKSDKAKANRRRYGATGAYNINSKKYYNTIGGHLHKSFHHMVERCSKSGYCLSKGTQCKFKSAEELIDHVVNELKVDPRGKEIHRMNNDGHYEVGNIEFLTGTIHRKLHAKMCRELNYEGQKN